MRKIEVCCGSLSDAIEAQAGGAVRVELCAALEVGGITPSFGMIKATKDCCREIDINVIIRPRGGDFVYTEDEIRQMLSDIEMCRELGVNGVVIGALTKDGDIDAATCRRLIEKARPLSVTFHRAFDVCRNPEKALEEIILLGCDRLLTSGQRENALLGAENIRRYAEQAKGRIIIMPGCGIRPQNIQEIERITLAPEFHSTARGETYINKVYKNPLVDFGENQPQSHADRNIVSKLVSK